MREILFRGKRMDNGGWITGRLIKDDRDGKEFIVSWIGYHCEEDIDSANRYIECFGFEVDPKTVGQYTGLEDVNGKKIFIGDIVKWGHLEHSRENPIRIALVIQRPGQIIFRCTSLKVKPWRDFLFGNFMYQNTERALEVIGTHWDNPELLEVE